MLAGLTFRHFCDNKALIFPTTFAVIALQYSIFYSIIAITNTLATTFRHLT